MEQFWQSNIKEILRANDCLKEAAIGPADPIEAITFRMEQQGLTPRDLEIYIGSSGRVSEVLNRRRSLSLRNVKRLHDGLRIPYASLLSWAA
jgi:HTH-type transcriptional regulator/antitoxin HigA